jgi:hypothetical protein
MWQFTGSAWNLADDSTGYRHQAAAVSWLAVDDGPPASTDAQTALNVVSAVLLERHTPGSTATQ